MKRRVKLSGEIEEAALRCFLDRGLERVTVDDIAVAAGVSRRTFYRYFPTPLAVLAELPRRGLERLIMNFRARPASEGIVEAFVNAMGEMELWENELEVRRLSAEVFRRWPDVWRGALGGMQNESIKLYTEIVTERLHAAGRDASYGGVIAATFSAVIVQLSSEHRETGAFNFDEVALDEALRALGAVLCDD
jgi:AcrR family transcriptional regulator